jgi:hypothetical protein
MADQLAFLPERVFTAAAMPGAGYRVQFFQSGTTTPVTVFTSPALSTPHPSPLTCDATGVFPAVFSPGGAIKAVVTKPDGSTHYTLDPVFRVPTSSSGAAEITFSPTVALPFENVQAAIEGAAATAASGFTPFGLGVTGTNALVANIDATNIASGAYRFDNTTTGTFPTGVVASDTGTLQIWRENSGDAVMRLQSGAADREFLRRMASSSWGAWREVVTVNQGAVEGDTVYRSATAWTRLAKGTASQALRMNSGATAPEWAHVGWTFQAKQNTTSGTVFDFTGIPSWANEIVVFMRDVSLSGTDAILVQIGDSGGIETTGYTNTIQLSEGANIVSTAAGDTAGFTISGANAANAMTTTVRMYRPDPATPEWIADAVIRRGAQFALMSGYKTLSDTLDRVRVTRSGTNTFDLGYVGLGYRA